MERMASQSTRMIQVIKAVFFSYIITILMLLLTAFLMLQFGLPGVGVSAAIIVTYILSAFMGSFYLGKQVEEKRFLWGLIAAGVYFCIYVILSLIIGSKDVQMGDYVKSFLIIAFSGMLGGMLS